jgi:hypothetical protein
MVMSLGGWGEDGGGCGWSVSEKRDIEDGPVPRPWRSVASQSAHERPPSAYPVSWLLYGGGGGGGGVLVTICRSGFTNLHPVASLFSAGVAQLYHVMENFYFKLQKENISNMQQYFTIV